MGHNDRITLHGVEDFAGMRKAGRLAAETLDFITPYVQAGITTNELDKLCADFIIQHGGINAPMNYRGYPKNVCISLNHVVCHGIPGDKKLQDGDILNIDVTPIVDGWHGDSSRMYYVGKPNVKARKLVEVTYEAMMRGINVVKPGATLGDVGWAIESFASKHRYSVVEDFCGHGLGRMFHEPPNVMHFGRPGQGLVLQEGMFFTIEPMINIGKAETKILADGWTAVTKDKSLSAQFEHSIAVTATGYEIFTESPMGLHCP
jgi:methionyl aminopeptidase